jgi:bifunctional non-homologous end joining protein LigD
MNESVIDIQGKRLKLSNLDKVLYPLNGFTKAQIIDYYVRVAPVLLPHLRNRPLTMKRYPEGVQGDFFYEKNCPSHRPEWVQTTSVWSEGNRRWMDYCLLQDLPTLVWAANLADIELHTSLSLASDILRPTVIVFDLDPGPPADMVQCCQAGVWVNLIFERLGLKAYPKTSGSKGLQVYVPLNTAVTYDQTKAFAHELARVLERAHPELIVSDMRKALRTGKVLVDWSQNDDHKTTICVYSLRAREQPTASTPITWEEVEDCLHEGNPHLLTFGYDQVLERVEQFDDLFEPVLQLRQTLPPVEALRGMEDVVAGTGTRAPAKVTVARARTRKARREPAA